MVRRLVVGLAILTAVTTMATAQESKVYAITGGTIYTLAGEPIEKGTVVIRDGRVSEVGANISVPAGAEVIDASGLEVYPGMMDAVSRLGLTEIGSTAATVDTTELGEINPQLVAATAVHPASEHIPVTRANGITHAVSAPGGGGASYGILGQASLIHLSGWTVEEMLVRRSVGMVLQWPTLETERMNPSTFETETRPFSEVREEYESRLGELREWLEAARRYRRSPDPPDLKLEALAAVVDGELPVLILADEARDIENAVTFSEEEGIRMVLLRGRDSWKVKELLSEKKIPVILGPTLSLPATEDTPYDKPLTTAGELERAGVRVIFASFDSADSRGLPYEVGNAVAYGLPWEEGLKAITLYPAELFGVSDQLGSIEEGKVANLIVTDGDPLEIRTRIRYVFIKGERTPLGNKQLELYQTYRARP
jgi:imidazolonepropionase-like amidohydrolase